MKVGFLVAGFKGFNFFQNIHLDCHVEFVASYESKGVANCFFNDLKKLCLSNKYKLYERSSLTREIVETADIIFVAGWQYIINQVDERFVVFHDSLLPKFRGFSPTVTALILGNKQIGVTALEASNFVDAGNIYEQSSLDINYPLKIKDAYLLLAKSYADIARSILTKAANKALVLVPQDESKATYSIWRDEEDYYIDWNWDSNKISRFVDAVGYPYEGARAMYKSEIIYIDKVEVIKERLFEDRHPGKIWYLNQGVPEVVCGKGMLKILLARNSDGSPVVFDRLRVRLTRK